MEGVDQIYKADDNTALRFFVEPTKNNFQSERLGRPIFDTSLYVEVMTPGSNESVPKFEVERTYCEEAGLDADGNRLVERSSYYERYAKQLDAYKRQTGAYVESGTPIGQWPHIDVGTAATLKAAGIHSVEMLAGVQDAHLQNLGTGGRILRDQAKAWVSSRQFGLPTVQMGAENAQLREELDRVRAENAGLTERLNTALAENSALRAGAPPPSQPVPSVQPVPSLVSAPNPFAGMESEVPPAPKSSKKTQKTI